MYINRPVADSRNTVIILEEDIAQRSALQLAIEGMGLVPCYADDGLDCLELMERAQEDSKRILGVVLGCAQCCTDTCRQLAEENPDTRLLILSPRLDADVRSILCAGKREFLSKPYSVLQLRATLMRLFMW